MYLRLVVDAENLLSVTAIEVPVDLPGEKVIVSGMVGLLVVERADSRELSEELVFIEVLAEETDDIDDELSWLTLSEEVINDEEVTVIGVVVGIEGINDKLEVTTSASDELVHVSLEDDFDLLSLTDELIEVVASSVPVDEDD